ncbi:MAG: 50S ribosomal protein L4 [bacterium]
MSAKIDKLSENEVEGWLEVPYNPGLIHQVVETYRANQRVDLASTRTRARVAGKNKKPWRQKGTGRARHGSEISPLWVGGGRAHGPDGEQNHGKKVTKQMKKRAFLSALTQRLDEEAVYLFTPPQLEQPSTSKLHEILAENELDSEKILLALTPEEKNLRLSVRNLPYCTPFDAESLNTYEIVANSQILLTPAGFEALKERFDYEA